MGGGTAPFHQLPGDPLHPAQTFWAQADDGVRLRLAHWPCPVTPQGTILLFPGRTEYIEKYARVAAILTGTGYAVLAIDWRGQGLSDRSPQNTRLGHVGQFADYQRDVVEMLVAATDLGLPRPWHLLAHSMGGCIGLAALQDGLPVASAVFSAPMWGIDLRGLPHSLALGLTSLAGRLRCGGQRVPGTGAYDTYVVAESFAANLLTTDAEEWCHMVREAAAWPDLTLGGASFDWVGKALNECRRLSATPSPDVPALTALGTEERIVSPAAIRDRMARWPRGTLLEMKGARHEIMMCSPDRRSAFLAAALDLFGSQS